MLIVIVIVIAIVIVKVWVRVNSVTVFSNGLTVLSSLPIFNVWPVSAAIEEDSAVVSWYDWLREKSTWKSGVRLGSLKWATRSSNSGKGKS